MLTVKLNGREIENPVLRTLMGVYALTVLVVLAIVYVVLSPLLVLMHGVLRYFDRRGFVYTEYTLGGPKTHINITADAFKRY